MAARKQRKSGTPKPKRKKSQTQRAASKPRLVRGGDWVGAQVEAPFTIDQPDAEGRANWHPRLTLWVEMPHRLVVGYALEDPSKPERSFVDALGDAMARPLEGPPRMPRCIRVSDPALAEQVRAARSELDVVVAPTPEIDELVEHMASTSAGGDGRPMSYFGDGDVPSELVEHLFAAAEELFRTAPWEVLSDDQLLRIDIPSLDIEGACVSVIGELKENLGFVLLESVDHYQAFVEAADPFMEDEPDFDLGASVVSLNYEHLDDLSPRMRREVGEHRWSVAAPEAHPLVIHVDANSRPEPAGEQEMRVVAACAHGLAAFFAVHKPRLKRALAEPIDVSVVDEQGLEVRVLFPYEAPGRDDVMELDEEAKAHTRFHRLDHQLCQLMMRFAEDRHRRAWLRAGEDFLEVEETFELFVQWSLYHHRVKGKPVAAWYMEAEGEELSADERACLEVQQGALLSVWKVTAVEPGRTVSLQDLLGGQERTIWAPGPSQSLEEQDTILARVVELPDGSGAALSGAHPCSLPLPHAEAVVEDVRRRSRLGRKPVAIERFSIPRVGRRLIMSWEVAIEELERLTDDEPVAANTNAKDERFMVLEGGTADSVEDGPDEAAAIQAFKQQHYAGWPNEPLPALKGKTPRQAVQTKAGRARLERLLDSMEEDEQSLAAAFRFDFNALRRELGLGE